jgi:hypothetical protein
VLCVLDCEWSIGTWVCPCQHQHMANSPLVPPLVIAAWQFCACTHCADNTHPCCAGVHGWRHSEAPGDTADAAQRAARLQRC